MAHVNKKIWLIVSFLLCFNIVYAQNKKKIDAIKKIVSNVLDDIIPAESIKDSTALYTGRLNIHVKKGKSQINVVFSDHRLNSLFKAIPLLEQINYTDYIGKKKMDFVLNFSFAVHDSSYNPAVISLSSASDAIWLLMRETNPDTINLGYYMVVYDKKVYE